MEERITKKIHTLRGKPQHVREAILLIVIAIAAAVLLTFWVSTFRFSAPKANSPESGAIGLFKNSFSGITAGSTSTNPSQAAAQASGVNSANQ